MTLSLYSSKDIGYLLLGPYDLKSVSEKLDVETSKAVSNTTPFGVAASEYFTGGVADNVISGHAGWYDDSTGSINDAMCALASGEHVFMFAAEGNTKGKKATCAGGTLKAAFKRSPAIGDVTRGEMTLGVSGVLDEAKIVKALAAVSGNGNTESDYLDLGAAGAAGANVYMSCTAIGAGTSLVITLEDSADHVSWADHTVMTALTAIGAEKKVATDLTVNQYVAAKHAFTGGTTTATYTLAVKVN